MSRRNRRRIAVTAWGLIVLPALVWAAQDVFRVIAKFEFSSNGAAPYYMSLVQGTDGRLYGTASQGGNTSCSSDSGRGCGTVFAVATSGKLATLYNFCSYTNCSDGSDPVAGLVLATDENFYGTTAEGGTSTACYYGCGTVFKVTREGGLTTLHSFDLTDGAYPTAALVQASDGNLYGVTEFGGTGSSCLDYCGTVFRITPGGVLTTIHNFSGPDGAGPFGGLVQGTDGSLYGTTASGGASGSCFSGCGTIFKITEAGSFTSLYNFAGPPYDGSGPVASLIQAADGAFYGTTGGGGTIDDGTLFTISSQGVVTVLHSFGTLRGDGTAPTAPLVQATDGNFYGTSLTGGLYENGNIFKSTPAGTVTDLHSFDYDAGDGPANPYGGLVQATNGVLYGTTWTAADSYGTVFSESVGLGPFVQTLPKARQVGQSVIILGTNLKGSTMVSFDGTPATFSVVSNTEIATTVPTGAHSGAVQVVTPGGTLKSSMAFQVIQ